MLGFAKSKLCKRLKHEQYKRPKLSGEALELDGVWMRAASGNVELKVARDERGVAVASAGSWEDALMTVHDLGASVPRHIVSDGDKAIDMAYGRRAPRQLCHFHLLREYTRNTRVMGFSETKALLGADDMEQAREYAGRIVALTGRQGALLACQSVAKEVDAGETRYRATSLLERFNREIRARSEWVRRGRFTTC